jgi:hypothetical protein
MGERQMFPVQTTTMREILTRTAYVARHNAPRTRKIHESRRITLRAPENRHIPEVRAGRATAQEDRHLAGSTPGIREPGRPAPSGRIPDRESVPSAAHTTRNNHTTRKLPRQVSEIRNISEIRRARTSVRQHTKLGRITSLGETGAKAPRFGISPRTKAGFQGENRTAHRTPNNHTTRKQPPQDPDFRDISEIRGSAPTRARDSTQNSEESPVSEDQGQRPRDSG